MPVHFYSTRIRILDAFYIAHNPVGEIKCCLREGLQKPCLRRLIAAILREIGHWPDYCDCDFK